ncbi:hypothetical protein K461DRAFT_290373 [Myriangium duriaei CBS 260.36]|uniref:MaoC-like domain-containing protein n=1 Tax=Myriangium duriaei CBS 260.36 TaxID=1168546 RepID=A0A9P4JEH8_9PEZI|nr:hypothetical protein K461DRAFT_290373 [Myriangium duriaei CBS 260.36]
MKFLRATRPATAVLRQHQRRCQSSFSHLDAELRARKIRPIFEDMTPLSSYRLGITMNEFLPSVPTPRLLPPATKADILPIPHHLVYFETSLPPSELLDDGTNPVHSPGKPFSRRMWAGGNIRYSTTNPLRLDGRRAACVEGIRSATVKGRPGEEKVFVGIERRLGYLNDDEVHALATVNATSDAAVSDIEARIRTRLWRDSEEDLGDCSVLERRNIVFLQESPKKQTTAADATPSPPKILKPTKEPSLFKHEILPDAKLLFRFSALTFNAHAIHLDPKFCLDIEGHRDLLFHGPLGYTFLMTLLQQKLAEGEKISYVEYRNLAPVYCNEPATFCGAKEGDKYEVWLQGPDGGVKVKGLVRTTRT